MASEETSWMQVRITAPSGVGRAVLEFLEQRFGYRHIDPIDWCTWERREDFSQVDCAPCEPLTANAYVVDWRKGEDRGDVPVVISPVSEVRDAQ